MTRSEIEQKQKENFDKIEGLKREIIELTKQAMLLSDEVQQFSEEIESHPKVKYQRKPHYLDGKLVGRIHWKELFQDEDTGNPIEIQRSQIVRINGEWI
jgi:hypothetical protein